MPYRTHPRIPFLPFSNPFVTYTVEPGKITTTGIGQDKTQTWIGSPSSVEPTDTGLWGLKDLFRLSAVEVVTPGNKKVYGPFFGSHHFMNAVNGVHPDVIASADKNDAAAAEAIKAAWHENFTSDDLADYAFLIPYLPKEILDLVWEQVAPHGPTGHNYGKIGGWADAGEEIVFTRNLFAIKAPARGQYAGGRYAFQEDFSAYPKALPELACVFRPIKGSYSETVWSKAYDMEEIDKYVQPYLNSNKDLPGKLKNREGFRERLAQAYGSLTSRPLTQISIANLPPLEAEMNPRNTPNSFAPTYDPRAWGRSGQSKPDGLDADM